jgi:hypothetical protein
MTSLFFDNREILLPTEQRALQSETRPSLWTLFFSLLGASQPILTSIMITVSGTLLLYDAAQGPPAQATNSRQHQPGQVRQRRDTKAQNEDIDTLPRFMSQTFILKPNQSQDGQITYAIEGETFRYVG